MKKALLLFFLILIITSCVTDDEPSDWALAVGDTLPSFSLEIHNGERVSNETLRGKVAFIVFFNTSCPDCRKELPEVQKVYDEFGNDPQIVFSAIARAEEAETIEKYWEENGLTIPWSAQNDREIFSLFASSGIPRVFIADTSGTITFTSSDVAIPDSQELTIALEKALKTAI